MQQYRKNLGKVSLTAEGVWDIKSKYDVLSIVYDEHTQHGFISKQPVPIGVDLYNSEYWMPLNVSGYTDSNIIILNKKTSDASIETYTLEEAVKSIASVGRKPGCILGFYNSNVNRLDIGGRWEIWQFNSTTISEWEDLSNWQNIYYNYNQFVGWYRNEEQLKINNPYPEVGCYAYVGNVLNEAVVYRCEIKHKWTETVQHAWDYVKIMIDGTVTVGENGNWYNNGEDTGIPANIKGDPGLSPYIRYNTSSNKLEYSYDKVKWIECSDYISTWFRLNNNKLEMSRDNANWNPVSDYIAAWFRWQATVGDTQANNVGRIQMSRDNGKTWTNMSNDFINNLHISRYIGVTESLPTNGIAEGTIYAKGPTYSADDTNFDNPIYRLWVYAWKDNTLAWQDNGEFTSIAAGVVQETGNSETEVMSQKAVSEKLNQLGSIIGVDLKFVNSGYINIDGSTLNNSMFSYTDYISVSPYDSIILGGWSGNNEVANIATYDENKNFISAISIGNDGLKYNEITIIPNNVSFVRISMANKTHTNYSTVVAKHVYNDVVNKEIKDYISSEPKTFIIQNLRTGYVDVDGYLLTSDNFSTSDYIRVAEGDIVYYSGFFGNETVSAISAYDKDKNFIKAIVTGKQNTSLNDLIQISSNIYYIRVSRANENHSLYQGGNVSVVVSADNLNYRTSDIEEIKESADFSKTEVSKIIKETEHYERLIPDNILKEKVVKRDGSITNDTQFNINIYNFNGQEFYITNTNSYNDSYSVMYFDESNLFISSEGLVLNTVVSRYLLKNIPQNCKYIYINTPNRVTGEIFIETKSIQLGDSHPLKGKNIAIIGDSISTIYDNNTPYWEVKSIDVGKEIKSYVTWNDIWSNSSGTVLSNKTIGGVILTEDMIGQLVTLTPNSSDVGKKIGVPLNYNNTETRVWSEVLCERTGAILLANASWSGSRITKHGDSKSWELSEAWSDYTIHRCQKRNDDGSYKTPDVIIIYRGTNDFSHTPYSKIDDVDLSNGIPDTDYNNGYQFRNGYYLTIQKLRKAYPNAIIYCATLNIFKRIIYDKFPTRNGIYTLPQLNNVIRNIANTMGCGIIEFDKDGITFENCYSEGYITDSSKEPTHPNSKGHEIMARKAIADITHTL